MPTYNLYSTTEELDILIRSFAIKCDLTGCFIGFGTPEYNTFEPRETPLSELSEKDQLVQAYLFPASHAPETFEDISPKMLRWVTIHPGKLVRRNNLELLTATWIFATDTASYRPSSNLKSVFRQNLITLGATSTNVVFGGSAYYPEIAYSTGALSLYNQGVLWKYEATDNAVVQPGRLANIPRT